MNDTAGGWLVNEVVTATYTATAVVPMTSNPNVGGRSKGTTRTSPSRKTTYIQTLLAVLLLASTSAATPTSSRARRGVAPAEECRLTAEPHRRAFADWLTLRNATHASALLPAGAGVALRRVDAFENGAVLTPRQDCTAADDADPRTAPTHERALCPFHYTLNYEPNRIPASITQAVCHCTEARRKLKHGAEVKCEPLEYQMRVLFFDAACQQYTPGVQTVVLACIPVIRTEATIDAENVRTIQPSVDGVNY